MKKLLKNKAKRNRNRITREVKSPRLEKIRENREGRNCRIPKDINIDKETPPPRLVKNKKSDED